MMNKLVLSALAAAALSADSTELQNLKAQMAQMEAMMKTMQQKIATLENAGTAKTTLNEEAHEHPADEHQDHSLAHEVHKAASGIDISLVLDASYVNRSKKDEELAHLELPGVAHGLFAPHNHNGSSHPTYNAQNGFNLNYGELGLHSSVTPNVEAEALLHFSENAVDIEEAFFTFCNLPYGLHLKGGKFLSDFGYLNSTHHHEWSFSDMPLVYEAFLGNHGIDEIGVQLQWVAPTSNYLMAGFEALQGKNESMFGNEALSDPRDTEVTLSGSPSQPSLLIGYVKTAAEFADTTLSAGVSWARGKSRIDHFSDETPYGFSGESDLYGIDFTLHHRFSGGAFLTWQNEWLHRDMEGTYFADDGTTLTPSAIRKKQSGYYSQLVYSPDEFWGIGARYDMIDRNDITGTDLFSPENMDQYTAMIEYRDGEFARYRLQYTHSDAFFNEAQQRQNIDSLIFSVNLLLGSHSDHSHD